MRTAAERQAEAARHQQMTEQARKPRVMTVELLTIKKMSVVLHTAQGDVTTTYGPNCDSHATSLILQYVQDGKNFSVIQSNW